MQATKLVRDLRCQHAVLLFDVFLMVCSEFQPHAARLYDEKRISCRTNIKQHLLPRVVSAGKATKHRPSSATRWQHHDSHTHIQNTLDLTMTHRLDI